MKEISFFTKIYLAAKPVDFRKQIQGLSLLVKEHLGCDPLENRSLFVFANRRRDAIRILYWDLTGFAMWSKVLEKDRFAWPKRVVDDKVTITAGDLKMLLQGIDIARLKKHAPLENRMIS
jgi:transposase